MSYGILVQNSDTRVILDETYSHIYPRISFQKSGGDVYPGSTSYQTQDLVLVSCNSSGYIAIGSDSSSNAAYLTTYLGGYHPAPTSGYTVVLGSKMAGNITPATSGYGMEIYNSSSQLVYTTSPFQFFRVLAVGNYQGAAANQAATELSFPSSIGLFEDLGNIFVLINNTAHLRLSTPPFFSLDIIIGYRYEYVSGTQGRVHVCVQDKSYGTAYGVDGVGLEYLILEKL